MEATNKINYHTKLKWHSVHHRIVLVFGLKECDKQLNLKLVEKEKKKSQGSFDSHMLPQSVHTDEQWKVELNLMICG